MLGSDKEQHDQALERFKTFLENISPPIDIVADVDPHSAFAERRAYLYEFGHIAESFMWIFIHDKLFWIQTQEDEGSGVTGYVSHKDDFRPFDKVVLGIRLIEKDMLFALHMLDVVIGKASLSELDDLMVQYFS